MLQRAGAGDGPVFGDVADQDQRHPGGFRRGGERAGHRAHLGDPARDAVGVGAGHGLHRVDDNQRRLHRLDVAEHGMQVRIGGQIQLVVAAAGPIGAHPDLAARLLAGDVKRATPARRPLMGDLEQQRRLANPRIAGQQRDRTRHHAATEDPVQFFDAGGAMAGAVRLDRADRNGGRRGAHRRTSATPDRTEHRDLVYGAPGAAFQATADPFGSDMAAFRATVLRACLGHPLTVSGGCDRSGEVSEVGFPAPKSAPPR